MGLSASYIVEKKMFKNTLKFGLTIGFLLKKKEVVVVEEEEEEEEEEEKKESPKA